MAGNVIDTPWGDVIVEETDYPAAIRRHATRGVEVETGAGRALVAFEAVHPSGPTDGEAVAERVSLVFYGGFVSSMANPAEQPLGRTTLRHEGGDVRWMAKVNLDPLASRVPGDLNMETILVDARGHVSWALGDARERLAVAVAGALDEAYGRDASFLRKVYSGVMEEPTRQLAEEIEEIRTQLAEAEARMERIRDVSVASGEAAEADAPAPRP